MNFSKHLSSNEVFRVVARAAFEEGLPCYVVGGYVRDLIIDRPNKDIDFVCVGSGIQWAQKVGAKLGGLPVTVFKNFGTAMIRHGEFELEFVGARKESYHQDSRKPV